MRGGIGAMLGFLGGGLMFIGVFLGVFVGGLAALISSNGASFLALGYSGIIDLVLAILVLAFTAYAAAHPPPDKAAGGVVLMVVAILAFVFTHSGWLIFVTIGAILALLAGLVFVLASAFTHR